MVKKKLVKFFVVVSVLTSVVGVGGKATYAKSIDSPKPRIEFINKVNFKERMEKLYKELHKRAPKIKEVVKNKSDKLMKIVIKNKDKVINNIIDSLIKKINQIAEKK